MGSEGSEWGVEGVGGEWRGREWRGGEWRGREWRGGEGDYNSLSPLKIHAKPPNDLPLS